ncbi:MAG: sensor histidine kinase [Bacillota bacterium]
MFNSIFRKLLVTYLIIIITIIAGISYMMSSFYSAYVFGEKEQTLRTAGTKVEDLIKDFYQKKTTKSELEASINAMGYVTDSRIYVLKIDEKSLADPEKLGLSDELMEGYLIQDMKEILQGRVVFRKNQYTQAFDTVMVFLGMPLQIQSKTEGVILIFSPVSQISANIAKINLRIWMGAAAAVIISAAAIYANSSRISRPIKVMDVAAKKIASGEDTEDIHIPSEDEVGQLAETFNYMKNKLTATERMRREFIANVSHDLKTPLTSIKGFAEGLLDGVIEPNEYEKYFKVIYDETDRLMKLTNDLLQLSKIESGSLKLIKEHVKIRDMMEDIIYSISGEYHGKEVSFGVHCLSDITVYGDRDRLKQIFINVVHNAIKYSRERVSIDIYARQIDGGVEIRIKDNGIGIEREQLEKIFEKFYRIEKSRHADYGGTGLGLSIVKNLVELHGGKIYAISEVNRGTEIIIEMPS